MMHWRDMTADQKAKVVRPLLGKGLSLSDIKERVGAPTRNAVAGLVYRRLGDAPRAKLPPGVRRGRKPKITSQARPRRQEPIPLPTTMIARWLDTVFGQCRFIADDPKRVSPDQLMVCGRPVREGHSWCSAHCGLFYEPEKKRAWRKLPIGEPA